MALARTLAIEPRVLLLDEPLSNLDAKLRHHMRRELVALQRRLGITTIFVTHDQEEALTTADRLAVMDRGVIQQVGDPMELFDAPSSRFVAEFIGSINLVRGSLQERDGASALFSSGAGVFSLPLPEGAPSRGEITLAFRPHALELALPQQSGDPARAWIPAQIGEREFLGEFIRYRMRAGNAELLADVPHRKGEPGFPNGANVMAGIDPTQVRVFST